MFTTGGMAPLPCSFKGCIATLCKTGRTWYWFCFVFHFYWSYLEITEGGFQHFSSVEEILGSEHIQVIPTLTAGLIHIQLFLAYKKSNLKTVYRDQIRVERLTYHKHNQTPETPISFLPTPKQELFIKCLIIKCLQFGFLQFVHFPLYFVYLKSISEIFILILNVKWNMRINSKGYLYKQKPYLYKQVWHFEKSLLKHSQMAWIYLLTQFSRHPFFIWEHSSGQWQWARWEEARVNL